MKSIPFRRLFWIPAAVVMAAAGCSTPPKLQSDGQPEGAFREPGSGLPHTMVEIDREGNRYTNQPNRVIPVDAHSLLVIEFSQKAQASRVAPSQEWKDLQSVLRLLNDRAVKWKALNDRPVDVRDPQAVKKLQDDVKAVADDALSLLNDLEAMDIRGEKMREVLSGRAVGLTNRARSPYLNMALWASNSWTELRIRAEAFQKLVESNSKVSVTVQAFRESLSGGRALLHIDDWDTRPEGALSPIDRTGLRPTEAEQKRLDTERAAAESAAQLINSIRTNNGAFKAVFQTKLAAFRNTSDRIQAELTEFAKGWKTNLLPAILTALDGPAASDNAAIKDAALNLRTNLLAIDRVFGIITNAASAPDRIRASLVSPSSADPVSLLLGNEGLTRIVEQLVIDVQTIVTEVGRIPARLQDSETRLQALAPEIRAQVAELLDAELKSQVEEFQQTFPAESRSIATLWILVKNSLGSAAAGEVLAATDTQLIPRTVDNLLPATLDLKKSGLALGDMVTLKLRATNTVSGELVTSDTFQNEIGLFGLHGKPAVHLIFARALSGSDDATDWKANVAAAVEWHYTIRQPKGGWGKTWNWLYPGAGIHLASLDQDEDSFELGTGGNISLWDGLLTGGVGFNFSSQDEYVWVGVNLLSLLNTAKDRFIAR